MKLHRLFRRPLHMKLTVSQARTAGTLQGVAALIARYPNLDGRRIRIDLTIRNEEKTGADPDAWGWRA